jgi:hypothetical protein
MNVDPLNTNPKKMSFAHKEYTIQGEMVMTKDSVSDIDFVRSSDPNYVGNLKFKLAQELGVELLKHGCIEFTSMKDPSDFVTHVRARTFVVSSDNVQILREKGF